MQADVCISTSVSKQLEEQRQKQDGSEPVALIVTLQPSVHMTIQSSGPVCVCLFVLCCILLLYRLPLLEQCETIGHKHRNTHMKEMRNPAFLDVSCPHSVRWPVEITSVTTFINHISLKLRVQECVNA